MQLLFFCQVLQARKCSSDVTIDTVTLTGLLHSVQRHAWA